MSAGVRLYHETQVSRLCGVHSLNTLLQGCYFSELDLGQIAAGLDQLEREVMAEGGLETQAYLQYAAEDSSNVAADGMFSSQVLSKALEVWGLSCPSLDSPDVRSLRQHPEYADAFICNLQEHWFTIRKVAGEWWDFNSLYPAPRPLSTTYLDTYLATLREEGYSIFVILGQLPAPSSSADSGNGSGAWYTPQQARDAAKKSQEVRQSGYLAAALNKMMPDGNPAAKQAMTKVTLRPGGVTQPSSSAWDAPGPAKRQAPWGGRAQNGNGQAHGSQDDEDAALASAIAASLADSTPSTGSASWPQQAPQQTDTFAAGEPSQPSAPPVEIAEPPDEPAAGPGVLQIALRMPQGKRVMRRFRSTDSVGAVISFVAWHDRDLQPDSLKLLPHSRKALDPGQTLEQAGVQTMELLTVER